MGLESKNNALKFSGKESLPILNFLLLPCTKYEIPWFLKHKGNPILFVTEDKQTLQWYAQFTGTPKEDQGDQLTKIQKQGLLVYKTNQQGPSQSNWQSNRKKRYPAILEGII